ncbi:glutamate 5-kinase [Hoeflea sp. CAU 1731]
MGKRGKQLREYRRVVIKIGSALLVDRARGLRHGWLEALCADIAALHATGVEIIVVSSGAIALGRTILPSGSALARAKSLRLEESQAAAAIGQIALAKAWSETLSANGILAGQLLLTLEDTRARRNYLNARATIGQLLKLGAVPVINENDTVATSEIRYGDNDRLAARVATMAGADLLVLLSDVDGLYTAAPGVDPQAQFIDYVPEVTASVFEMAGDAGSELSRGGMKTKIEAGRIATGAGCAMIIASGKVNHPIAAIDDCARHTFFAARNAHVTARKTWIAGQLQPAGVFTIDEGAAAALLSGKSLLPAGVRHIDGSFERGDTIVIRNLEGREIARGLSAYGAEEATRIAGRKSSEIIEILGYAGRTAMIHRDDMVLTVGDLATNEDG